MISAADPKGLIEKFFIDYPSYNAEEKDKILRAWDYLVTHTATVGRSCGQPYYEHPFRVAEIVAQSGLDADTVVSAFFHNILDLEHINGDEIEELFGKDILRIITGTTRITGMQINNKTLQQADTVRKMLFAMVDDIRIILVKMADRLDRMRFLKSVSPESQKAIAQEVIDIWAPLANRLGMSNVKSEMEDLSLKYTNPDVFQHLKQLVALKKSERAEYLDRAEREILKHAAKDGLEVSISSRAKHFYSIYQKMRKRNKAAEELYDLLALRIICKTTADCYTVVGIVHTLWKPLDGRFKDYIAMPKANGYQSLHTSVLYDGKPLEIQIRTEGMHAVAEHGVASHWLYKKGTSKDLVSIESLSIINQLKELRKENLADEELFAEIKDELLGDSIFVFTPKGDVRELPAGSTAIDFAYSIHSHIGETIVGAKANGSIIPLSSPLKNTQIIEILTSPQAHPTINQLPHVKTAKARSKIRAYLQENDPSFDIEKTVPPPPKQAHTNPHRSGTGEQNEVNTKSYNGDAVKIRIGDTTNFLITIARCCSPMYGDEIVGYVSRGRGLIVHKADCRNFFRIPNINERSVEVVWEQNPPQEPKKPKKR